MTRIRQQHPQNYLSSGNISTEFENLIRYLNAAEHGDNTLGELLGKIFDENGNWNVPIKFRKDPSAGIQYRIGTYKDEEKGTDEEKGWINLVTLAEIRGEAGKDFGEIGAPIIFGRADYIATNGQTDFDYAHDATDELLVYVDGILKTPGGSNDYTSDNTGGTNNAGGVTFNAGLMVDEVVTIYKIRATSITGFTRQDTFTTSTQAVFPFVHSPQTKLQVYKNGILLREGAAYDYVASATTSTVTFTSAIPSGNLISIITVENTSVQAATGMMFEEKYVNPTSGLIRLDKISIADGEVSQEKVANLMADLGAKAKLTVSATTPTSPASGELWHDTSHMPNQLKFYDGTQWLRTSPDSSLPTFTASNAGEFVKVNGTGTALEYGSVDLSPVIAVTQKGSANGVASLDSTGRLPSSQLPSVLSSDSLYQNETTPTNSQYAVKRIYKQKIRIDGMALQTTSGTCSVQITVDGTAYGSVYSVSSTPNEFTLGTPIEIDATNGSHAIGFAVTNNASASVLEVTMAISVIAS